MAASLGQNYPNPFSDETRIDFTLDFPSEVEIVVTDVLGRRVDVLVSDRLGIGAHSVRWRPNHIAGGLYYYQLRANSGTITRSMLVLQ